MERKDVLQKLTIIFRDVMDNERIILSDETKGEDIDGWDSLAYVQIVAAIGEIFKVKLSAKEMILCENVGEIVDVIEKKLV